jgi:gliding motility-associated-like protein
LLFVIQTSANGVCAADFDSVSVIRTDAPIVQFTSTNACVGQTTVFTDNSTGGANSWNWTFGPSPADTSTQQNPNFTFPSSGTFTVTLIASSGPGCVDTLSQIVNVNSLPIANFSFINACAYDSVSFTDSSTVTPGSIVSWNWSFGDSTNSNLISPSHLYDSAGTYSVSLTVLSDSGCSNTFNQTITVFDVPEAAFSSITFCDSLLANFTNTSSTDATSFQWNFGDGDTSSIVNPSHTYSDSGSFIVNLVAINSNGCSDTSQTSVSISTPVHADYSPPGGNFAVGVPIQLTNLSTGASQFEWYFNNGQATDTTLNPSVNFNQPGTYNVILIAYNGNCSDTADYVFNLGETGYTVPSGFTPNGDGLNDFFWVRGGPFSEYELRVFNEWGNQIFISNNQMTKWDGTFKGVTLQTGTYIYVFSGKLVNGSDVKLQGEINLIR